MRTSRLLSVSAAASLTFLLARPFTAGDWPVILKRLWWKPSPARVWGVLAIPVALGSVLGLLQQSLGSVLIPVVVYSLVLSCMGISAMLADLGNPLAGFGALLFIASDVRKFSRR